MTQIFDYGVDRNYATPQEAFDALQEENEIGAESVVVFTGVGLDDLAHGAGSLPLSGLPEYEVRVEIDGTGPDTFKYSLTGGADWEATGVAITGAEQALGATGMTVDFGAAAGHTLGDRWDWSTSYSNTPFTEKKYLRGYGDAIYNGYDVGQPPLRLAHSVTGRGIATTGPFRLILDRNGTDRIDLVDDQEAGGLVGGAADGTALASHVTIEAGVVIHSASVATGKGIIVCPDRTGGETAEDWVIRTDVYTAQYGIVAGCLRGLKIENARFPGQNSGACFYADGSSGTYGAFSGALTLLNFAGRAGGRGIHLACLDATVILGHVALYAEDHVLELNDDGASVFLGVVLLNSILYTPTDSKFCLRSDFAGLLPILADANCYYFPGEDAGLASVDASDYLTLADWQEAWGGDANSIAADPLMADAFGGEFTLTDTSPCRMRGRAMAACGLEGHERTISVDIGPYQPSLPANWLIRAEGGEIFAKIEGRIKANLS